MARAGAALLADRESVLARHDRLELRLWLRLLTCATMVERRLGARLRGGFATTLARFDLLAQLDRQPDGLAMGELSERMMVSNGNVTGLVDRLAAEGLVGRTATPGDRRSVRVALTPAGKRAFDAMTPEHARWIDAMLAGLDRDEKAALHRLLGRLKESVRAADGDAP